MINSRLGTLILAGGLGQRMGSKNKGLIPFGQTDLIDPVLQAAQQCCAYVAISANQDIEMYRQKQVDVWNDVAPWSGCGPLAGVCSSEQYFPESIEYIQVVPCDSPFISTQVIQALSKHLQNTANTAVYVQTATQIYPVIFQFKRSEISRLKQYLMASNKHSIRKWLDEVNAKPVEFEDDSLFVNMNDMSTLTRYLPKGATQ